MLWTNPESLEFEKIERTEKIVLVLHHAENRTRMRAALELSAACFAVLQGLGAIIPGMGEA